MPNGVPGHTSALWSRLPNRLSREPRMLTRRPPSAKSSNSMYFACAKSIPERPHRCTPWRRFALFQFVDRFLASSRLEVRSSERLAQPARRAPAGSWWQTYALSSRTRSSRLANEWEDESPLICQASSKRKAPGSFPPGVFVQNIHDQADQIEVAMYAEADRHVVHVLLRNSDTAVRDSRVNLLPIPLPNAARPVVAPRGSFWYSTSTPM